LLNWKSTSSVAALLNYFFDRTIMRTFAVLTVLLFMAATAVSQVAGQPAQSAPAATAASAPILAGLDRLQAAAAQTNVDLGHMRIEKWKADNASKQQAQGNADSLQRNLSSALPGLISSYRADPQNLNAGFKLYRNLNALYDVMASFTEATGAFGPKSDYEALAQQLNVFDTVRRDLGDNLDGLTTQTQTELNQLRTQVHTLQQAAAAPATPPKKVIVDNAEPAKKATTTHKKKPAATSSDSGSATKTPSTQSSSSQSPSSQQPKSQ
jgi:hypothetical protein